MCLNLEADHLEWHGGADAYRAAKAKVYENTVVACVYNKADEATLRMVEEADVEEGCRAVGFGLDAPGPSEVGIVTGDGVSVLADRVAGLPEGLDTVGGARGYRFSGGEQQRLAIARTVLRDPKVLVLDEATSALDNQTQRALQTALDRLRAGRTTITIAHRLSTIEEADEIVVLEGGAVVEHGGRDALLAREGRFATLAA